MTPSDILVQNLTSISAPHSSEATLTQISRELVLAAELRRNPHRSFEGVAHESVSSVVDKNKSNASAALGKVFKEEFEQLKSTLTRTNLSAEQRKELIAKVFQDLEEKITLLEKEHGWKPNQLKKFLLENLDVVPLEAEPPLTFGDLRKGNLSPSQLTKAATAALKLVDALTTLYRDLKVSTLGVHCDSLIIELKYGSPGYSSNGARNYCGPEALYYLLASKRVLGEERPPVQQAAAIGKILLSKTAPGIVGTTPDRLTPAIEAATNGKYTLATHQFTSSKDAVKFALSNVPCLVKYGSGITQQHYDTIIEVSETATGRVFRTSSGLAIPEEKLAEMMEQRPFANHVWTLKEKRLDPKAPLPSGMLK